MPLVPTGRSAASYFFSKCLLVNMLGMRAVQVHDASPWQTTARMGGRPPTFDAERYKERNTVERCVNKLRQFRAVATRYDKRERIYQATIDVASIRIWLRPPSPDPRELTTM